MHAEWTIRHKTSRIRYHFSLLFLLATLAKAGNNEWKIISQFHHNKKLPKYPTKCLKHYVHCELWNISYDTCHAPPTPAPTKPVALAGSSVSPPHYSWALATSYPRWPSSEVRLLCKPYNARALCSWLAAWWPITGSTTTLLRCWRQLRGRGGCLGRKGLLLW